MHALEGGNVINVVLNFVILMTLHQSLAVQWRPKFLTLSFYDRLLIWSSKLIFSTRRLRRYECFCKTLKLSLNRNWLDAIDKNPLCFPCFCFLSLSILLSFVVYSPHFILEPNFDPFNQSYYKSVGMSRGLWSDKERYSLLNIWKPRALQILHGSVHVMRMYICIIVQVVTVEQNTVPSKVKITIPLEPELETAQRAQRIRLDTVNLCKILMTKIKPFLELVELQTLTCLAGLKMLQW